MSINIRSVRVIKADNARMAESDRLALQSSNEADAVPSKKWKADHAALRLKFEEMRKAKSQTPNPLVPPAREPRYDQVFEEGVRVLNRLDEPSSPIDAEVEFTRDVWHSPLRTDDGLP